MKKKLLMALFLFAIATKTFAVRPFITDDAAVTGHRLVQLETWALFEKVYGQHWTMLSFGFHNKLEVAVGALWGYDKPQPGQSKLSFAMPLLEAKYLFREYQSGKPPGIALSAGTFLPGGKGEFVAPGYGAYSLLIATQCFGNNEDVLIHGNLGLNYLYADKGNQFLPIWGLGAQVRAYKGLHLVGEIIAGDPYVPGTGTAYHAGFRYFVSEFIQFDTSFGQGIAGEKKVPFWAGFGARFVMNWF